MDSSGKYTLFYSTRPSSSFCTHAVAKEDKELALLLKNTEVEQRTAIWDHSVRDFLKKIAKECASVNLETGRLPAQPAKLGTTVRAVIDKGDSVPNSMRLCGQARGHRQRARARWLLIVQAQRVIYTLSRWQRGSPA